MFFFVRLEGEVPAVAAKKAYARVEGPAAGGLRSNGGDKPEPWKTG